MAGVINCTLHQQQHVLKLVLLCHYYKVDVNVDENSNISLCQGKQVTMEISQEMPPRFSPHQPKIDQF